jgi:3-oxoacyl-[acyl-carrier-protein] synthase III
MMRSRIVSMGHYVPDRIVKNSELEHILDIKDEAIVKRTGIRERRYVTPGTSCSDIAFEAGYTWAGTLLRWLDSVSGK